MSRSRQYPNIEFEELIREEPVSLQVFARIAYYDGFDRFNHESGSKQLDPEDIQRICMLVKDFIGNVQDAHCAVNLSKGELEKRDAIDEVILQKSCDEMGGDETLKADARKFLEGDLSVILEPVVYNPKTGLQICSSSPRVGNIARLAQCYLKNLSGIQIAVNPLEPEHPGANQPYLDTGSRN